MKEKEENMGFDLCGPGNLQFRLTIWGMDVARQVLTEVGVLDWKTKEPEMVPIEARWDLNEAAAETADTALAIRSPDPGKVPGLKLSTNDGWIVTADECRILATALRLCTSEMVRAALEQRRHWFAKVRSAAAPDQQAAARARDGGRECPPPGCRRLDDPVTDEEVVHLLDSLGRQFAEFCERCGTAGGFRVY